MKIVYIVTNCGYRPAVAFESKERAEAVCAMCGGSMDEVQVLDAVPSMVDFLKDTNEALAERETCDGEEGDGDGL